MEKTDLFITNSILKIYSTKTSINVRLHCKCIIKEFTEIMK